MEFLFIAVIFILIVGVGIFIVIKRGMEMKSLALEGTPAKAKILKKFNKRVGKRRHSTVFTYEFLDALGNPHQHTIHVTQGVYQQYQEGDEIEIVYLLNRPQISAAKYLVDEVRTAV